MNLWEEKKEDLTQKTGTKEKFIDDGIYEVIVKEAYISESKKSKAKAITVVFENDENYGRANFWYTKGDGSENEFARKSLNRMFYLMKLKANKLNTETKKIKTYSGEEIERIYFTDLSGKEVGIILFVKEEGDNTNYEIKDFFDIKSRKTSDEIINKTDAYTVPFFEEKFQGAATNKAEENNTVEEEDDDEFPF